MREIKVKGPKTTKVEVSGRVWQRVASKIDPDALCTVMLTWHWRANWTTASITSEFFGTWMKMGFKARSLSWLITRGIFGLFLDPRGLPRLLFEDGGIWWEEDSIALWKVCTSEDGGVIVLGLTIVDGWERCSQIWDG